MLRSDFLNKLTKKKRESIVIGKKDKMLEDDNYVIQSNRPLIENEIKRLPKFKIDKLVEKVLTNKRINTVLFSSISQKEIQFVKKSSQFQLLPKMRAKETTEAFVSPQAIVNQRLQRELINSIGKEAQQQKADKEDKRANLKKKIKTFHIHQRTRSAIEVNNQNQKLVEYKRNRFTSIFNSIKSRLVHSTVELPDIKVDPENVYSRLYNNVIIKSEKENKLKNSTSNSAFENVNHTMNVKKVLANSTGKEFTLKISNRELMKCYKKYSGGPEASNLELDEKDLTNNLELKDSEGNTFLHMSVKSKLIELVTYFLERGLNPNAKNKDGNTPLHLAMILNYKNMISLLLMYNADLDVENKKKENPVDVANVICLNKIRLTQGRF